MYLYNNKHHTFISFLKGHRVEVLGISNVVLLPTPIVIEVTPMLPILKLSSTLPRAPNSSSLNPEDKHYQTLFTSANLYRGHRYTIQPKLPQNQHQLCFFKKCKKCFFIKFGYKL